MSDDGWGPTEVETNHVDENGDDSGSNHGKSGGGGSGDNKCRNCRQVNLREVSGLDSES